MNYRVSYYFGSNVKTSKLVNTYDLERILEFMKDKWDMSPESINVVFEAVKK